MKKFTFLALLFLLTASVFAGSFSFEALNQKDFFQESTYDQYSFKTQFGALYFPKEGDADLKIRLAVSPKTDPTKVTYIDVSSNENHDSSLYIKGKIAAGANLAHFSFDNGTFPKIEGQISLKGYLNALLNADGSNQFQGMDGSYFYGAEFLIADKLALRAGMHHLSGHFADEVLEDLFESNLFSQTTTLKSYGVSSTKELVIDDTTYIYHAPTEYVRDNELLLSASYNLPLGFRPYFQFAMPTYKSWVRPFIHTPLALKQTVEHIAWGETIMDGNDQARFSVAKVEEDRKEGVSYKAIRLNAGFDWTMCFGDFGVTAGFDAQFNQDGMTGHMPNTFSKDNPWEFEYSTGASFELYNAIKSKTLSLDVIYHNGRVPLLNYYYIHTGMLFIGLSVH